MFNTKISFLDILRRVLYLGHPIRNLSFSSKVRTTENNIPFNLQNHLPLLFFLS